MHASIRKLIKDKFMAETRLFACCIMHMCESGIEICLKSIILKLYNYIYIIISFLPANIT